ncbi:MAG: tripartite tricarboxylate transporter substrate binding protein [Xanthobacteraceae bacterium]|nr:tripartite tricarboxylate transporter substrate binding protein [Xanthobacteraceae bacterium]
MTLPRRAFLQIAAGAAALPLASLPFCSRLASAQPYPSRPVRIIVGFAPAGASDIAARLMAQWLSERMGQQFVVENRPGAGSNIATEAVVRSPPDGYTLLLAGPPNAINASLYQNLSFNFLTDIVPVASINREPSLVQINPSLPVNSIPELIAYAKANPGKINHASAGTGTAGHIAGEMFKMMTGVSFVHVPYRGGAPAVTDLIGGRMHIMFGNVLTSLEQVRAGKLRALAVTSTTPHDALPGIPTVSQFVPGYEATSVYGIGAPRGTPATIVERLNRDINAGLADPKIRARLAELGSSAFATSPAEYAKFVADETERLGKVVKFAGAKAE